MFLACSIQTNYNQCLTVFCPTVDEAVGQFYILQLEIH